VHATKHNVFAGRRPVETMLLIRTVEPFERWSWHLLAPKRDVEISLRSVASDRTLVTVTSTGREAGAAVKRLYDLVQTAAET
jgi:hypothetical protein